MDSPTLPLSNVTRGDGRDAGERIPGVVVVFPGGARGARVFSLATGPVEIGRGDGPGKLDDGRISRLHARIAYEGGRCIVTDLGSQNGTFVDGELVAPRAPTHAQRVIRLGDSLLVPYPDVRPFERAGVRTIDGFVRGPAMQAMLEDAARTAQSSITLHVHGESGTGKEGIVHAFHRASPRAARPLVAVNCATIPHAIAERLLFGAKRGTYSGAETDAPGYVQEADGSTLFLDEIADLDPQVQAKLLRVLESKELLPLGASRPRKVDFALCSATNKDLRALVSAGTLREDLYFRIGRPAVTLPPLRSRPEEIPALIVDALTALPTAPTPHVTLVEQCLLRVWPGNIRELLVEIRTAAQLAVTEDNRVTARHLSPTAGSVFGGAMPEVHPISPNDPDASPSPGRNKRTSRDDVAWRARIEQALEASAGNVAAAARALGLHRTQLRRLLERFAIATTDKDDDKQES
ncbi:MAG TPA: sigma 54-interacting transcriptional regulator [Kofleriaceae bacterium]|nr:sigma 54-interacting transcriptional regulator [Kofleriaceae bacterium]